MNGIAYMEGIVKELKWEEWNEQSRGLFQAMRSDAGEELILEKYFYRKNSHWFNHQRS